MNQTMDVGSPSGSGLTPGGVSAHVAQLVEHVLGKDEVTSSILVVGSKSREAWAPQAEC